MESTSHDGGDASGNGHSCDGDFVWERESLFERRGRLKGDDGGRLQWFVTCTGLSWEDCPVGNKRNVPWYVSTI